MLKELKIKDQTYKFQTNLYIGSVLIFLFVAVFFFIKGGLDPNQHLFINCPSKTIGYCYNPLFENMAYCGKTINASDPICNKELLTPGETWGIPPPKILETFPLFITMILTLAFIINHFLYNKGFMFIKAFKDIGGDLKDE